MAPKKTARPATTKASKTPTRAERTPSAAAPGETEEVIVRGRLATAGTAKPKAPGVVQPEHELVTDGETELVRVKAIKVGEYGHKRRRIGEVFDMHVTKDLKELPSWVIDLADAEPGQDEGSRGLHSGGREDERIREERQKNALKPKGPGAKNIIDPTIINDALPLSEGGNERKPAGGAEHVI